MAKLSESIKKIMAVAEAVNEITRTRSSQPKVSQQPWKAPLKDDDRAYISAAQPPPCPFCNAAHWAFNYSVIIGSLTTVLDCSTKMQQVLRLTVAIVYLLMAVTGTLTNSLLLLAFIRGRKQFKMYPFFIISWQILVCDSLGLFLQFTLVIPEIFAGYWIYSHPLVLSFGSIDSLSYNAALGFAFLLTINRFCIFVLPQVERFLFQSARIFTMIAMIWLFALVNVIGSYSTGYYVDFSIEEYHLLVVNPEGNPFRAFGNMYATWTPVLMFAIYFITFARLVSVRGSMSIVCFNKNTILSDQNSSRLGNSTLGSRVEILFLLQGSLFCIIYLLEHMAFAFLPDIIFVANVIKILLLTVHSFIILSFNSKVRSEVANLPCIARLAKTQKIFKSKTITISVSSSSLKVNSSL